MSFHEPPIPASYIILKETIDTTDYYYAINGKTGETEFGGLGNVGGVTGTDASAVIQAAINALTSGGTIFFKAGSYVILGTLTIQTDFIWLIGEGRDVVELRTTNDIHVISLDKPDHSALSKIKIANMRIYGRGTGSTKACIYCRNLWYSTFETLTLGYSYYGLQTYAATSGERGGHNSLFNVDVVNNVGDGLYFYRVDTWVLNHVTSHGNTANGIRLAYSAQGFKFTDVFCSDNGQSGLWLDNSQVHTIVGYEASGNGQYGLKITSGSKDIRVLAPYIESSNLNNIIIQAETAKVLEIKIIGGEIVKAQRYGIVIKGTTGYNVSDVKFIGTNILNNGLELDDTYEGVYITDDGSANTGARQIYLTHCKVGNLPEWGNQYQRGIKSLSLSDEVYIYWCDVSTAKTLKISLVGSNNKLFNNKGYVTEKSGTETISAGQVSVTVTHELDVTPSLEKIKLTPLDDLAGRSIWVSDATSTSFKINMSSEDIINHVIGWSYNE